MRLAMQAVAGAKWTGTSSAINASSEIAKTIVLARLLSPIDFGLMAMVTIVIGFVQTYIDLGISAALIHRQDSTREELASLYWLNLVVGCGAFCLLWLCTPLLVLVFHEPRVASLLRAIGCVFLITPLGAQFQVLLQRQLKFRALALQESTANIIGLIVAIVLALRGFGVWALVYSFLANSVFRTVCLVIVGLRRFRPMFHFSWSDLNEYIGFGLFQIGERTLIYLTDRVDQILIGNVLGAGALGYYNFAYNLCARPIGLINPVLIRVAFPLFAKLQSDIVRLRSGYLRLVELVSLLNAPILLGFAAISPLAVPVIFGKRWVGSVLIIQILCVVHLMRSTINPIGSLQLAKGRADMGFWWNVGCFGVSTPTIYFAGRAWGAFGIAWSLVLLQVIQHFVLYICVIKPLIGDCAGQYAKVQLKPTLMAFAMAALLVILPDGLDGIPPFAELTAKIVVGSCLYLGFLLIFHRTELRSLRSLVVPR